MVTSEKMSNKSNTSIGRKQNTKKYSFRVSWHKRTQTSFMFRHLFNLDRFWVLYRQQTLTTTNVDALTFPVEIYFYLLFWLLRVGSSLLWLF